MLADAKPSKKKKNTYTVDVSKNLKPTPNSTQALNVVLQYLYSSEIDFDAYSPVLVCNEPSTFVSLSCQGSVPLCGT